MEFMVSVRFCDPTRSQGLAQDAENRMYGGVAEVAREMPLSRPTLGLRCFD